MVRRGKRQNIRPNAFGVCFTFLLARNPKACIRKKKRRKKEKVLTDVSLVKDREHCSRMGERMELAVL